MNNIELEQNIENIELNLGEDLIEVNLQGGVRGKQGEIGPEGPQGKPGPANIIGIGTVTSGDTPSANITGESPNQTLNLVLPKGDPGNDGVDGRDGEDGIGIESIEQTTTSDESGGSNVITVTMTDGNTSEFVVKNGEKGEDGESYDDTEVRDLIANKVDKVANMGLSENSFTDSDKSNLDSNTSARHTHNNKQILDQTTASYTTVDKSNLDNNTSARHIHSNKSVLDEISSDDISEWANKYEKPSSGIPKSDLASDVQTSLGKADTAIQDISGKVDKVEGKGLSTNDFTDNDKSNLDNNTNARHTHSNKSVLDDITSTDIENWDAKADYGFYGIISGTSANPTDGASLPNGVYKADESKTTSYISLAMVDGTTKKQSVQRGGIVIRTNARLIVLATQNLMYQYDMALAGFYPAEPFVESVLRREFVDGIADLGTISPPNNYFITLPISYLDATVNTGEAGHTSITFTVEDEIAKGDFQLNLVDSDGNELIYNNGALPKPVSGETWIFDIYGNRCNATLYKGTYLDRDRDEQILFLVRSNSDQIYYPNLDSKPSITVQSARGSTDEGRPVVMEYSEPFLTSFQNVEYYGIPKFIPLDLSIYNTSTQANMLHPHSQLPDGNYWVKSPGRMWVAGESYMLVGKELIYKNGDILGINGGEYTVAYYAWDSTEDDYKGGFFTTYQDVTDAISEINYEPALTVVRQTTVSGTTTVNNGKWSKRVNPVNSMTLAMANLTEIPDTFKARVTVQTSATFTSFHISQRTAFKVYFAGWDCTNGVLAGKPNAFYNIDYRSDGRGNIIAMVTGYDVPTT